MSRRIRGGRLAAAALALALTLAAPAHAAGLNGWDLEPGLLLRAWHWLTGEWSAPAARPGRAGRPNVKSGMGVDPNGGNGLGTGSTAGSTVPGGGGTVSSSGG